MITILTSSPTGPLDGARRVNGLDPYNHFIETLKHYWVEDARLLLVAADPDAYDENDEEIAFFAHALEQAGLSYRSYDIFDHRKRNISQKALQKFDVIFLGGGHVPTQNRYFRQIGLKKKLRLFQGLVIGISAGTMNAAGVVYAIPELPGEARDPSYQRYLSGLALTPIQVIPHFQMIRHSRLDGYAVIDEIASQDSHQGEFIGLNDGSYIVIDETAVLYGEAYLIYDGKLSLYNKHNETRVLYGKEAEHE